MDKKILKIMGNGRHLMALTEITTEGEMPVRVPIRLSEGMTNDDFDKEVLRVLERRGFNRGLSVNEDQVSLLRARFQDQVGKVAPIKGAPIKPIKPVKPIK